MVYSASFNQPQHIREGLINTAVMCVEQIAEHGVSRMDNIIVIIENKYGEKERVADYSNCNSGNSNHFTLY